MIPSTLRSSSVRATRRGIAALAATVLGAGCVHHLESPRNADATAEEGGTEIGSDYEPPDNRWAGCELPPADLAPEGFGEGEVLPDLRMNDQFGDEVSLWQFYGMVIAVDLSTMWCGPCKELATHVTETWEDYEDECMVYLTILPETATGTPPVASDAREWANAFGIEAPVLADTDQVGYELVPDRQWPRVMVVGRDMRVIEGQVTPAKDEAIRAAIESAL